MITLDPQPQPGHPDFAVTTAKLTLATPNYEHYVSADFGDLMRALEAGEMFVAHVVVRQRPKRCVINPRFVVSVEALTI